MITLGFVGDTMLGRQVADLLDEQPDAVVVDDGVRAAARDADAVVVNLECCISARGEPWPAPGKPFFFRAPPHAVRVLAEIGTDLVTLANNHALDFGPVALEDTLVHLRAAGIGHVGAGSDRTEARRPARLEVGGAEVAVIAATDHPEDFAACPDRPGVAFADLPAGATAWIEDAVAASRADADVVVVTVHWGPNMVTAPVPHVRAAADRFLRAGADLVVGHSAHVFHGVRWHGSAAVLYDVGDFLDDYAVDPALRNDLGVLWLVRLDGPRVVEVDAVPLTLEHCFTRLAAGDDRRWIERRLTDACAPFGSAVVPVDDRLRIRPSGGADAGS